ncbi:MAG: hypothetical protein R3F26_06975 [Gammaproteobacteria bacterium]
MKVVRSAGRPHLSFTSGSSVTLLLDRGREVVCPLKEQVWVNLFQRFVFAAPAFAGEHVATHGCRHGQSA